MAKAGAKEWILAARPKTLTAALAPLMVATALIPALGHEIQWWITGYALMSALFIQVGTNLVNDAIDYIKGADTETRLGPVRVTQKGYFTSKQVLLAASLCFCVAVLFGIPLVIEGGAVILMIGIFSVLCGYAYTAGPFPLAYTGLGDLFVILFFGIIAVGGVVYLQIHQWPEEALWAGLQVGFLGTVLIAINNLRDIEGDRLVNKKTLAVRLGVHGARIWIVLLLTLPFVMNLYWVKFQDWLSVLLPLLLIPLAVKIGFGVLKNRPGDTYNKYLAQSALLQLGFCLFLSVGLYL